MADKISVLGRLHAATEENILTTAKEIEFTELDSSKTTVQDALLGYVKYLSGSDIDKLLSAIKKNRLEINKAITIICTESTDNYTKGRIYLINTNGVIEDITALGSANGLQLNCTLSEYDISTETDLTVNFVWSSVNIGYGTVNIYVDNVKITSSRYQPGSYSVVIPNTFKLGIHTLRLEVIDSGSVTNNVIKNFTVGSFVIRTVLKSEIINLNDSLELEYSYTEINKDVMVSISVNDEEIVNESAKDFVKHLSLTKPGFNTIKTYCYYLDEDNIYKTNIVENSVVVLDTDGIYLEHISSVSEVENNIMFSLEFNLYSNVAVNYYGNMFVYDNAENEYVSYPDMYYQRENVNNGKQTVNIFGLSSGKYKLTITAQSEVAEKSIDFEFNVFESNIGKIAKIENSLLYHFDTTNKANNDGNNKLKNLVNDSYDDIILSGFNFIASEDVIGRNGFINDKLVFSNASSAVINYKPFSISNIGSLTDVGFTLQFIIDDANDILSNQALISCYDGKNGFVITNHTIVFYNDKVANSCYYNGLNTKKRIALVLDVSNGYYYKHNTFNVYIDDVLTASYPIDINNKPVCESNITIGNAIMSISDVKIYGKPLLHREILVNDAVALDYNDELIKKNNLDYTYTKILKQMTLVETSDGIMLNYTDSSSNSAVDYYAILTDSDGNTLNNIPDDDVYVELYSDKAHTENEYINIGIASVHKFKLVSSYNDTTYITNRLLSELPINTTNAGLNLKEHNCYDGSYGIPVTYGIINADTNNQYKKIGLYLAEVLPDIEDQVEEDELNQMSDHIVYQLSDSDKLDEVYPEGARENIRSILNEISTFATSVVSADNITDLTAFTNKKTELCNKLYKVLDKEALLEWQAARLMTDNSDIILNKFIQIGEYSDYVVAGRPYFNLSTGENYTLLDVYSDVNIINLYSVKDNKIVIDSEYVNEICNKIDELVAKYHEYIDDIPEIEYNMSIIDNQFLNEDYDLITGNGYDNFVINSIIIKHALNNLITTQSVLTIDIEPTTSPEILLNCNSYYTTSVEFISESGNVASSESISTDVDTKVTGPNSVINQIKIYNPENVSVLKFSKCCPINFTSNVQNELITELTFENIECENFKNINIHIDDKPIFANLTTIKFDTITYNIGTLDLSNYTALENIIFSQAGADCIIFPEKGILKNIVLPTQLTKLEIIHNYNIETLTYGDLSSLKSLYIDDVNLEFDSFDSIIGKLILRIDSLPESTVINANINLSTDSLDRFDYIIDNSIDSVKFNGTITYTGISLPAHSDTVYKTQFPDLTIVYKNITDLSGVFAGNNISGEYDEIISKANATLLSYANITSINNMFANNINIKYITRDLFNGVIIEQESPSGMFTNCSNLRYLEIPTFIKQFKLSNINGYNNIVLVVSDATELVKDDDFIESNNHIDIIYINNIARSSVLSKNYCEYTVVSADPIFAKVTLYSDPNSYLYTTTIGNNKFLIDSSSEAEVLTELTITDEITYLYHSCYNLPITANANISLNLSDLNQHIFTDVFNYVTGINISLAGIIPAGYMEDLIFGSLTVTATEIKDKAFKDAEFTNSQDEPFKTVVNFGMESFKDCITNEFSLALNDNITVKESTFSSKYNNKIYLDLGNSTGSNIGKDAFYNINFDEWLIIEDTYNTDNQSFDSEFNEHDNVILNKSSLELSIANRFVINNVGEDVEHSNYNITDNIIERFEYEIDTVNKYAYVYSVECGSTQCIIPDQINGYTIKALFGNSIKSNNGKITSIYFIDSHIEYLGSNLLVDDFGADFVYLSTNDNKYLPESINMIKPGNKFKYTTWYTNTISDVYKNTDSDVIIDNVLIGTFSSSKTVNINDTNITTVYDNAYYDSGVKYATINAEYIYPQSFANCSLLNKVIIGNRNKYLAKTAFAKCSGLSYIELNNSTGLFDVVDNNVVNTLIITDVNNVNKVLSDNNFSKLSRLSRLIFGSYTTRDISGDIDIKDILGIDSSVVYKNTDSTILIPNSDFTTSDTIDLRFIQPNKFDTANILLFGLSFAEQESNLPTLVCNYDLFKTFNNPKYASLFAKRFKTKYINTNISYPDVIAPDYNSSSSSTSSSGKVSSAEIEALKQQINDIIAGAPEKYDTLKEIADKLSTLDIKDKELETLIKESADKVQVIVTEGISNTKFVNIDDSIVKYYLKNQTDATLTTEFTSKDSITLVISDLEEDKDNDQKAQTIEHGFYSSVQFKIGESVPAINIELADNVAAKYKLLQFISTNHCIISKNHTIADFCDANSIIRIFFECDGLAVHAMVQQISLEGE